MFESNNDTEQDVLTASRPVMHSWSRVWGVMFYLDGLFVSGSNGVPPLTPSCVLLLGQACC